jgi:hypothetical protein
MKKFIESLFEVTDGLKFRNNGSRAIVDAINENEHAQKCYMDFFEMSKKPNVVHFGRQMKEIIGLEPRLKKFIFPMSRNSNKVEWHFKKSFEMVDLDIDPDIVSQATRRKFEMIIGKKKASSAKSFSIKHGSKTILFIDTLDDVVVFEIINRIKKKVAKEILKSSAG